MIGGGEYSLIGNTHRLAMELAGLELVGGVFSSKPKESARFGKKLGLSPDRVHGTVEELLQQEMLRPAGERIQGVVIVTPNHLHYSMVRMFINAGFHVVVDKPLVHTLREAETLTRLHQKKLTTCHQVVMVTYSYTGYPMVKLAKKLISLGRIGNLRKVVVEYSQGWLSGLVEKQGVKKAVWRTDPRTSGLAGTVADIGTHAENLVSYVTGLSIKTLMAQLSTLVRGRKIDDDGNILVNYEGGTVGVMITSQASTGEGNHLALQVYGEKGSVKWDLLDPEVLTLYTEKKGEVVYEGLNGMNVKLLGKLGADYHQRLTKIKSLLKKNPGKWGRDLSSAKVQNLLAFSNIYSEAAKHMRSQKTKIKTNKNYDYPNLVAGTQGMKFIEKAVESSRKQKWVHF